MALQLCASRITSATSTRPASMSGSRANPATSPRGEVPVTRVQRIVGLAAFGLFVAALTLYLLTLAPVVTFVDSGELAAAIATSGVSHPSGSPLYLLFGALIKAIPGGSLIWKLNAFSAICAALCVGVTAIYMAQKEPVVTQRVKQQKSRAAKKN